jgi:hypothetical protein
MFILQDFSFVISTGGALKMKPGLWVALYETKVVTETSATAFQASDSQIWLPAAFMNNRERSDESLFFTVTKFRFSLGVPFLLHFVIAESV